MKDEYRTYKNIVYFIQRTDTGFSFLIRDYGVRSQQEYTDKSAAMEEARKQIDIIKPKSRRKGKRVK